MREDERVPPCQPVSYYLQHNVSTCCVFLTRLSDQVLARYYTLSDEDLSLIKQRRRTHKLGFTVQRAYLRFPGRPAKTSPRAPLALQNLLRSPPRFLLSQQYWHLPCVLVFGLSFSILMV